MIKNILGVVPVHEDGSAYFEVPAGRALYFQALDEQGREIQRMRTFVQAAPGVTRSCVGCHENKMTAPANTKAATRSQETAAQPAAESWGSGYIDYATMIQPILDKHCVECHGGEDDIAAGIDLSGGWTWAFNISYETLLKNNLVGFIRCHNSDTTSSDILAPRHNRLGRRSAREVAARRPRRTASARSQNRSVILIMAWMDTNSNYYGTWNWTEYATCEAILSAGSALATEMKQAGCTSCHQGRSRQRLGKPAASWAQPNPAGASEEIRQAGDGLEWCRGERLRPVGCLLSLREDMPPDVFRPPSWPQRDPQGQVQRHLRINCESTLSEHARNHPQGPRGSAEPCARGHARRED